jgi:hypothetical protein
MGEFRDMGIPAQVVKKKIRGTWKFLSIYLCSGS